MLEPGPLACIPRTSVRRARTCQAPGRALCAALFHRPISEGPAGQGGVRSLVLCCRAALGLGRSPPPLPCGQGCGPYTLSSPSSPGGVRNAPCLLPVASPLPEEMCGKAATGSSSHRGLASPEPSPRPARCAGATRPAAEPDSLQERGPV